MKKNILSFSSVLLSGFLLFSCGDATTETKTEVVEVETATEEPTEPSKGDLDHELQLKLDMIISNNMLVPMSIISDLKSDGKSLYHEEYTNSLDNIHLYDDKFSKALNFGVYGVDVIYNLAHDHKEEIEGYREKTLPLATSLGLESFYNEEDMAAFNAAANDDAALSKFIFDEYHKIDEYLVDHHNFEVATLVLCGGIIESMFFTGKSIEEYGISETKYGLLLNERNTMGQLIDLLGHFENYEKDNVLKAELQEVYDAFNEIKSMEELTPERIKILDEYVIELRNKVVNNDY